MIKKRKQDSLDQLHNADKARSTRVQQEPRPNNKQSQNEVSNGESNLKRKTNGGIVDLKNEL